MKQFNVTYTILGNTYDEIVDARDWEDAESQISTKYGISTEDVLCVADVKLAHIDTSPRMLPF